jgi:hypothetical protein
MSFRSAMICCSKLVMVYLTFRTETEATMATIRS